MTLNLKYPGLNPILFESTEKKDSVSVIIIVAFLSQPIYRLLEKAFKSRGTAVD